MPISDQENCDQSYPRPTPDAPDQCAIGCPNDEFRTSLMGGEVTITSGVQALGNEALKSILQAVREHDRFDADNDPHGEHDFGCFTWGVHTLFWKIDYYDQAMEFGSPNPAEPKLTCRLLTIMLASEY
ncbi:MAG: DUF3768 domain-containing protein [Burkholderiales bacterium]